MNREEAIKKLADIIFDAARDGYIPFDVNDERCAKSIARERINDFYPAPPSNLDEAAFEYENTLWEDGCKDCGYSPLEVFDAFKAGAEWMTKQGVTVNGYITDEIAYNGVAVILDSEENFKPEDEVVVQIRKK